MQKRNREAVEKTEQNYHKPENTTGLLFLK